MTVTTTATKSSVGFKALSMKGISRIYGKGAPALSNLDLELARGEFVALLGPSGCGKSTALACLAGLQPLSGGSIWRDEQRIDGLPPEKRGFGMVFQSYALFPHLTVQKNVEFGLLMRKVAKAQRQQRAKKALDQVQLADQAERLPSQLSGGQQQRVAIARALAIEPEVILMDEPLSNLDAALRIEMRTEIKRLYQERDLTVLYVTHDQEEALSLATRLVVLRAGKLEQTGTPEAVYTTPASAYVAGFMGYRNLFTAKVGTVSPQGRAGVVAHRTLIEGTLQAGDAARVGDEVTVAIRPEDFVVGSTGEPDTITAVADVVEYHGRELSVRARTADDTILYVKTTRPVLAGSNISLSVPPERVLLYPGTKDLVEVTEQIHA